MSADFDIVEFFNGHNTDKAHPFIEDCIAKQVPFVKVNYLTSLPHWEQLVYMSFHYNYNFN